MSSPRISLSQLSEYLTASASRRKSIIADAADPKPYIAQTYNAAIKAISHDILHPDATGAKIQSEITQLQNLLTSSIDEWQKQHAKHCIEAIKKYLEQRAGIGLLDWIVMKPSVGPGEMKIAGVRVTISPEAIITKKKDNIITVGAVKFYFSKSKDLTSKRADYMGALIHWYCEAQLKALGTAEHKCSMVVNLPGNSIHFAPRAKIRNRKDINDACEEIAARWPS